MVLFATAFRSKSTDEKKPAAEMAQITTMPEETGDIAATLPSTPLLTNEEVDQVLDQFVSAPTLGDNTSTELSMGTDLGFEITPQSEPVVSQVPDVAPVAKAPAASTPAAKPKADFAATSTVTVTVKKGDFLEKIAKANNSSVAAIMKANNMTSTALKIGQVLKVPSKGASSAVAATKPKEATAAAPAASGSGEYYVVKDGDSPWLIASKNHVKLEELLKLNNLDDQKARKLRPGDRLRIR